MARRRNPDSPPRVRLVGFDKQRALRPAVEAFIRDVFDASHPLPFQNAYRTQRVLAHIEAVVEVLPEHGGIKIETLRALSRRKGEGTKAMRFLTDLADKHGVELYLYAKPFGDEKMPLDDLVRFYRRFGFRQYEEADEEEDEYEGVEMHRWPREVWPQEAQRTNPARRGSHVYHLTYASDLPFIARQGLVPRADTEAAWDNEPGIYFVSKFGYEAGAPESEEPAWLRFPAPKNLPPKFFSGLHEAHANTVFPPEVIEVWVDGRGRPVSSSEKGRWRPLAQRTNPARRNPSQLPVAHYAALATSLRAADRAGHLDYPNDRDTALRAWASEHGVAFLGAGMHRVVFRVPEGALKLSLKPVWHDRLYGNLAEARVWDEAPPLLRKHLVPILAVADDGAWLLQEYAPTTGRERTPKEQRNVDAMWKAMSRCGYMDFQGNNIADDGRLLDYGSAEYPEMWKRCVSRAAAKKTNPARKAKPPTLAAAGLPEVWFHGTQKTFARLKAQGGACVWLADKAGAMVYATPSYGRRSAIRLIEVTLAPDTRVVDLADASDPAVLAFIYLDASVSNMRWHGREDVTPAEMADAVARWNARRTHYDAIEARPWAKAHFRKAGADALLVRDVAGWGGHEAMPSLCLLNAKKVVSERDVAPDLSLVRAENLPKHPNPRAARRKVTR